MSTPVGHSLVGMCILFLAACGEFFSGRPKQILLFCIIIACLPDIDFIPGIFAGNINAYHHRGTHTLLFAIIVPLVVWLVVRSKDRLKLTVLSFALVMSHLAVDYVTVDKTEPFGIPFFWPLSERYFYSGLAFLPDVFRGETVRTVFNLHNLGTVAREIAVFSPVAVITYFFCRGRLERQDAI